MSETFVFKTHSFIEGFIIFTYFEKDYTQVKYYI